MQKKSVYKIVGRVIVYPTRLFFLIVFSAFPLTLEAKEERGAIESLIEATKKNLDNQEKLLKAFIDFKEARLAFIEEPTSRKAATVLVLKALSLNNLIEGGNLAYLFSKETLEELNFYNKVIAQKLNSR